MSAPQKNGPPLCTFGTPGPILSSPWAKQPSETVHLVWCSLSVVSTLKCSYTSYGRSFYTQTTPELHLGVETTLQTTLV